MIKIGDLIATSSHPSSTDPPMAPGASPQRVPQPRTAAPLLGPSLSELCQSLQAPVLPPPYHGHPWE